MQQSTASRFLARRGTWMLLLCVAVIYAATKTDGSIIITMETTLPDMETTLPDKILTQFLKGGSLTPAPAGTIVNAGTIANAIDGLSQDEKELLRRRLTGVDAHSEPDSADQLKIKNSPILPEDVSWLSVQVGSIPVPDKLKIKNSPRKLLRNYTAVLTRAIKELLNLKTAKVRTVDVPAKEFSDLSNYMKWKHDEVQYDEVQYDEGSYSVDVDAELNEIKQMFQELVEFLSEREPTLNMLINARINLELSDENLKKLLSLDELSAEKIDENLLLNVSAVARLQTFYSYNGYRGTEHLIHYKDWENLKLKEVDMTDKPLAFHMTLVVPLALRWNMTADHSDHFELLNKLKDSPKVDDAKLLEFLEYLLEYQQSKQKLFELEETIKILRGQIGQIRGQIEKLEERGDHHLEPHLKGQIGKMKDTLGKLKGQIGKLKDTLTNKEITLVKVESHIREKKMAIENIRGQIGQPDMSEKIENIYKKIEEKKKTNSYDLKYVEETNLEEKINAQMKDARQLAEVLREEIKKLKVKNIGAGGARND